MRQRAVVLVAEDSMVVRALLRSQLQDHGYAVVEAADGEEALAMAAEARPDVILLDVEMPRLDGFSVLERLRGEPALAGIPVVFVSGRTNAEDAIRGLELGAHDYLRKPFEAGELAARVGAAARAKRLRDELHALNDELRARTGTDELTGLASRSRLDEELRRACAVGARHGRPLTALVLGIDRLEALNAEHGHRAGDAVLAGIAARLRRRLRAEDLAGRWAGDELLVVAPELGEDGGRALAESLRREVERAPVESGGRTLAVTASVGYAEWRGEDPAALVDRARSGLLRAKALGRNRSEPG